MPRLARMTLRSTAVLGLMLLSAPIAALHAQPAAAPPAAPPAATAGAAPAATATREETVEQRITNLHATLQITAAEEGDWAHVAAAMRSNAGIMGHHVAERDDRSRKTMTAVDDLKMYQSFAQAHLDGLKALTTSFETLYKSMPDAQKKNADMVFDRFGHDSDEKKI